MKRLRLWLMLLAALCLVPALPVAAAPPPPQGGGTPMLMNPAPQGGRLAHPQGMNPHGGGMRPSVGRQLAPQQGAHPHRPLIGDVTAVEPDGLTLALPNGEERQIAVDEATRYFVPEVAEPTLEDIHVGDRVRVGLRPPAEPEAVPVARSVAVIPEDAAGLRGTLSAVGETSVTVETRLDQSITVQVDETTRVLIPGEEGATPEALQEGDRVEIGGRWLDTSTFQAWIIRVDRRPIRRMARGRILTLGTSQFTLGTMDGVVTVQVDEATRYRQGGEEVGFDALAEGQFVTVAGEKQDDGTWLALRVVIGFARPR